MSSTPDSYEIISALETNKATFERRIQEHLSSRLDSYLERLDELADGIWILYRAPDGSVTKTYRRPPDPKVLMYLVDRLIGKPTQQLETTTQSQGLISVQHIIKKLSDASNNVSEGVSIDIVSQ